MPMRLGDTAPMEPAELERQLVETRRQRFFVRSQRNVLRRHRDRQTAAGHPIDSSDARLAELELELQQLDDAVEALRARLGRPHRRRS
jgi:predicted RNase H-like nuclease (RuvC/YqgF family)